MNYILAFILLVAATLSAQEIQSFDNLGREELDRLLTKSSLSRDLEGSEYILNFYRWHRSDWWIDAEEVYIEKFRKISSKFGTPEENDVLVTSGNILKFLRHTHSPSILQLVRENYTKVNDYHFPDKILTAGWPIPKNPDQRKGVKGQMLSSLISVGDENFIRSKIAEAKLLDEDTDQRLLIIWALAYSANAEAESFLRSLVSSEVDREATLARSALSFMYNYTFKEQRNSNMAERLKSLGDFISAQGIRSAVTAGEYYPD